MIYLIVGLGNPGNEYKLTRHNVGFNVIEALEKEYNISVDKPRFKALIGEIKIGDKKIILMKPQTYMNSSGESVREICDWYKIPANNIVVIYDDIDIPWKRLRIRPKGSAGSHNGLKSVLNFLGSDEFNRVRVGIGKPPQGFDLIDYVLGKFSKEQQKDLSLVVNNAKEAVKCIIDSDIDTAMNKFN